MDYTLALRMTLIVGLMSGGLMLAFLVFGIVAVKAAAQGKWYIEIDHGGESTYHLTKPVDGFFAVADCNYNVPIQAARHVYYPFGLPRIMQALVQHEKYYSGNPHPVPNTNAFESRGLGHREYSINMAETRTIKQVNDAMIAEFDKKLKLPELIIVIGVPLTLILAGVAAYFAYSLSADIATIAESLKGI